MDIVFFLPTLLRSNHPRIVPVDRTKHIKKAWDIDPVQNRKVNSTAVVFWIKNNTAAPASMIPNTSLKLIAITLSFAGIAPLVNICFWTDNDRSCLHQPLIIHRAEMFFLFCLWFWSFLRSSPWHISEHGLLWNLPSLAAQIILHYRRILLAAYGVVVFDPDAVRLFLFSGIACLIYR